MDENLDNTSYLCRGIRHSMFNSFDEPKIRLHAGQKFSTKFAGGRGKTAIRSAGRGNVGVGKSDRPREG